jgi:hypothetical protein
MPAATLPAGTVSGRFLVSWLADTSQRDLDDAVVIEATCARCLHVWLQSPVQLLVKVSHRDLRAESARFSTVAVCGKSKTSCGFAFAARLAFRIPCSFS